MASGDQRAGIPNQLNGVGLRVGIVSARWNNTIVDRLQQGVHQALTQLKVRQYEEVSVPGCFEIPQACQALATSGSFDAIVCIGVVIRGETTHYEIVAEGCASSVQRVQLDTGVPIGFGVLTVENEGQALARSEVAEGLDAASWSELHNVGSEAAFVAVEMSRLLETWKSR